MITPDLLVSWPRNCDYPLWRKFIRENRARFNEVIIVFTETSSGDNFWDFVRQSMIPDGVTCLYSPNPGSGQDWRDVAMHHALAHVRSEWIWFTEQDFYPLGGFWEDVEWGRDSGNEVIAAFEGDRMHPCSIFIKRELLNRTTKNFGIVPGKSDHFGALQRDLEVLKKDVWTINPTTYKHYNGLSQNFYLGYLGQTPNYKLDEFQDYLRQCLDSGIELDPRFITVANRVLKL